MIIRLRAQAGKRRMMVDAFTLIEIMVVVAIMGVILGMSLPSMLMSLRKESVRKAAADLQEACNNTRARAILNGVVAELILHPKDLRFEAAGGTSYQIPDGVTIEMADVNLHEYREEETARVRFFPNGTSDEMTVAFVSKKNEWRAVSLEVTTGLADIETDMKKLK